MTVDQKKVRIGILGCSDIARRRFLPAVLSSRNAVLSAIGSRDRKKAEGFFPSAPYTPMRCEELIESADVDLVYISVPNDLHEDWSVKALCAGKHVICEKPLGLSVSSIDRMVGCAEQRGLLLCENIMYLHHPQHQRARDIIRSGVIGKVRELRSSFGFMLKDCGGFRTQVDQGGGSFLDQARYPLSAALFFLEGSRYRFHGHAYSRNGLNVAMQANAVTDRNERFMFSIGFEQQYACWYEIVGDKGLLRVDRAYTIPVDHTNTIQIITSSGVTSVSMPAADHFQLMLDKVCDTVLHEKNYRDYYRHAGRLAMLADQVWNSCDQVDLGERKLTHNDQILELP